MYCDEGLESKTVNQSLSSGIDTKYLCGDPTGWSP